MTDFFGEVDLDEEAIISFENGILAFEEFKEYILIDLPENPKFKWLQAVHNKNLGFLVTTPFYFFPSYEFDLKEKVKQDLAIKTEEDVAVFTIVTLGQDVAKMTTNLLGPIVINVNTKKALQIVLDDVRYSTKELVFRVNPDAENEDSVKEACK